jgi:hypothetical protein
MEMSVLEEAKFKDKKNLEMREREREERPEEKE